MAKKLISIATLFVLMAVSYSALLRLRMKQKMLLFTVM